MLKANAGTCSVATVTRAADEGTGDNLGTGACCVNVRNTSAIKGVTAALLTASVRSNLSASIDVVTASLLEAACCNCASAARTGSSQTTGVGASARRHRGM